MCERNLSKKCVKCKVRSGYKTTLLTSVFLSHTSVIGALRGTMLMAFADVNADVDGC
jgi:hypothetical protein